MLLPNEGLAVAVATEWDSQGDKIQQQNMHIVSINYAEISNIYLLLICNYFKFVVELITHYSF